jgi:hypothetical protein
MEGMGLVWDIRAVPAHVREEKRKQGAIAV